MQLDREYILRMIKGRSTGAVVVEGSGGGGGGVTLGPLLTSLNAEAMPTAEGYLHWTGSDWDFTSIDLSSYATETWVTSQLNTLGGNLQNWVLQQGYVPSSAISDMATETWVLQQGYVTSSAVSDMATETWVQQQGYITASAVSAGWKVKDVEVVDDNSVIISGEEVIYGASFTNDGLLTLARARLSIYEPEYTSDLINDSGFINQYTADGRYLQLTAGGSNPLTGSLFWNVANQTENLIISNNKIQLSVSGTPHNIVLFEGSTASLTSYAKFYERPMVKTGTNNGTPVYTNVALVSEVEAKQNIIHFFNTKNSNTEVSFSNIYLPLNYQLGGTVYLDLSDYVTALGVSGDDLTYTKNGTTTNLTVPFATDSKTLRNFFDSRPESANNQYGDGKLRHYMATSSMTTGKPPVDAHIIHSAWDDNTLGYDAQLAIGNSNSGLFYRTQSQGTWQAWKQVAIIDNLNTLGDNLQTYVNTQLGGYLPLTAGSSKPLTSSLYVTPEAGTHQTVEIRGSQYYIGLAIGSGNVNRGLYGQTIGGSGSWLLYFDANNTIMNYGNVGIGTTTPAAKLDVNGVAKANYILFKKYNDSNNAGYCGRGNGSNNNIYLMSYAENLCLGANSSYYDIFINTSHNVGIGTTSPQAKLDVNGSVVIAGALAGVTNIDGLMIFDSTNAQVSTRYINIGEENYRMSIYADDEAAKFDGATDGAYYFFNGGSTPNGSIYAGSGNFSGNLTAGNRPSDADQKLYVGGSAVITGYVGIGTRPTGTYTVDVDGTIYASSSVHASSFVNNSDIRMKDVTRFIEPSVHDIAIAPIIEFVWKNGDGSKNIGSIAQYWQTVFPQAVHEGGDGLLSMEYGNIALASAITAARHSLNNERRIAELELRVAELEDELAAMVSQQSETTDN